MLIISTNKNNGGEIEGDPEIIVNQEIESYPLAINESRDVVEYLEKKVCLPKRESI